MITGYLKQNKKAGKWNHKNTKCKRRQKMNKRKMID